MASVAGSGPAKVDTLVFVDLIGVLNVSIRDPEGPPLVFNEDNVEIAYRKQRLDSTGAQRGIIESLVATSEKYHSFAIDDSKDQFSELLVEHFADLIRSLPGRPKVVLCCSRRKSASLEGLISRKLCRPFVFDDVTGSFASGETDGAAAVQKLRTIGSFISKHAHTCQTQTLQVLVLSSLHFWRPAVCQGDGPRLGSIMAAEELLAAMAPKWLQVRARIIHTYDELRSNSGGLVRIGSGLTQEHVGRAIDFCCATRKKANCKKMTFIV